MFLRGVCSYLLSPTQTLIHTHTHAHTVCPKPTSQFLALSPTRGHHSPGKLINSQFLLLKGPGNSCLYPSCLP